MHGLRQVVTATMPKSSADTLAANVRSGKLKTLGGKIIEAVEFSEFSTGAISHHHARHHCHGLAGRRARTIGDGVGCRQITEL